MSMPRARMTRTALGCSGLGWLPALSARDRAAGELLGQRFGHLRARAVAGARNSTRARAAAPCGGPGCVGDGPRPGLGAARRRRRPAARRSARDRARSRCRGRRPGCDAPRPARRRAAGAGGRRRGSGARRPAHTAPRRAGRCGPARSAAASAAGGPPAGGTGAGELASGRAGTTTRRTIHQVRLMHHPFEPSAVDAPSADIAPGASMTASAGRPAYPAFSAARTSTAASRPRMASSRASP